MSEELYVAVRRSPEDNRWSHLHFGKAPLPVIDDLMMLSGTDAVNPGDIITVLSVDDISSIDNKYGIFGSSTILAKLLLSDLFRQPKERD